MTQSYKELKRAPPPRPKDRGMWQWRLYLDLKIGACGAVSLAPVDDPRQRQASAHPHLGCCRRRIFDPRVVDGAHCCLEGLCERAQVTERKVGFVELAFGEAFGEDLVDELADPLGCVVRAGPDYRLAGVREH